VIHNTTATRNAINAFFLSPVPGAELGQLFPDEFGAAFELVMLRLMEGVHEEIQQEIHDDEQGHGKEHPLEKRNLDMGELFDQGNSDEVWRRSNGRPDPPADEA